MTMMRALRVAFLGTGLLAAFAGTAEAQQAQAPAAAQQATAAGPPVATAATAAPAAPADATADTARMRRAMHAYFDGEKNEAWAFGAAGIVTVAGSAGLFAASDKLYRGAAFPIGIVGVIQLAAGIVLLVKTDGIVADLDRRLDHGKAAFLELEKPRMEKVRAQFGWLAATELALVVAGIGLAAYGGARDDHLLTGIGGGLALQSAAMLAFDTEASARADRYSAAIDAYAR